MISVIKVGRAETEWMIKNKHYLHRWPGVVVLILALMEGAIPKGCIVFALPPRETCKRYGAMTWELARLWIDDSLGTNTESWFISRSIRYIRKNHPDVQCLVSYADPSVGHSGIIYKASNWISDGRTDQERKTPRFDYQIGEKIYSRKSHVPDGEPVVRIPRISKFRFVFWMKEHEKRRVSSLIRIPGKVFVPVPSAQRAPSPCLFVP